MRNLKESYPEGLRLPGLPRNFGPALPVPMRHLFVTFVSFCSFCGMQRSVQAQPAGHNPSWIQGQASLRALGVDQSSRIPNSGSFWNVCLPHSFSGQWIGLQAGVTLFPTSQAVTVPGGCNTQVGKVQTTVSWSAGKPRQLCCIGSWHCWPQLCVDTFAVSGQNSQQI